MALQPMGDAGDGAADFAGDEGLSPRRPLVIEENAVGCVESVGLPIVHGDPIGVELGRRIGTAGIKRCGLALRRLLDLAVELRGGGLIEPNRKSTRLNSSH